MKDYLHYIPCFRLNEKSTIVKRKAVGWIQKNVIPSYMRWFCNRCDLVFAPSTGMQQVIREYGWIRRPQSFRQGLTELFSEKTSDGRRRYENSTAGGKRHLLVTVSRLEKEKNYGFLLRGIADLRQELGDEFHVLIIGEGSQKSELKVRASILAYRMW